MVRIQYRAAPALQRAQDGDTTIKIGHRGGPVESVQALLNRANPGLGLEEDGYFGRLTEDAVRAFQTRSGIAVDGKIGPDTLAALRGTGPQRSTDEPPDQLGRARPSLHASIPTGKPALLVPTTRRPVAPPSVARPSHQPEAETPAPTTPRRRRAPPRGPRRPARPAPPAARPAAPVTSLAVPQSAGADAQLAERQQIAITSAAREFDAGIRETSDNRSPRIDEYARAAGHRPGLEWCGNFVAFNMRQAGMQGGTYGATQMSNAHRAAHFFTYQRSTNGVDMQQVAAQRRAHEGQGSTRQFWTVPGSYVENPQRGWHVPDVTGDQVRRPQDLPLRAGDVMMIQSGATLGSFHICMVDSYDPATGRLTTIEGNSGRGIRRREYNLIEDRDPRGRPFISRLYGFGRPALGDFTDSPILPQS